MRYNFLNRLVLRSPAYSYLHYSPAAIAEVLQTASFQTALFLASPDLHALLESKNFDYEALSPRERLTVLRYYNRMCFRPTPFGSFSSFSAVTWNEEETIVLDSRHPNLHLSIDQETISRIANALGESNLTGTCYTCNPTLYRFGKDFRLITTTFSAEKSKIYFNLESMESDNLTDELLAFCGPDHFQGKKLIAHMMRISGCDLPVAMDYLQFLIGAQIFVPVTAANIIREDYLERLLAIPGKPSVHRSSLKQVLGRLQKHRNIDAGYLKTVKVQINSLMSGLGVLNSTQIYYSGLEINAVSGTLDRSNQDQLSDGMNALSLLVPSSQPPMLAKFIRDFPINTTSVRSLCFRPLTLISGLATARY